ncbi:MAG: F0F1 ATP synthase subunit B [Chloroflexota bacterium]
MDVFSAAGPIRDAASALAQETSTEPGFQINLFWVIAQALSFVLFLAILYFAAFRRIGATLEERRERIEQGLRDAEQARKDREAAEQERLAALQEARREANSIIDRAQKVAADTREQDIRATREELDRMRENATQEIDAEKQRALGELRAEVADLALMAASRVVGESMNAERQRRLVEEFLTTPTPAAAGSDDVRRGDGSA